MAVWKVQPIARCSAATGEPFPPDTEIVTALFGDEPEEGGEDAVRGAAFARRDYLPSEAGPEQLAGAYCVWRRRTPPERAPAEKRFDLAMAREFLERLLQEGREDRAAVCLTLALLLARKRRLMIVDQDATHLVARWPRETATFAVPAPAVGEAEAEGLQQELMRLFDVDAAGAAAETPAGPEAAGEGGDPAGVEDDPARDPARDPD
jgi:hypothetical protein